MPKAPGDPWLAAWAAEIPRTLSGIANAMQAGRLTEPVVHKSRRELKRLRSLLLLAPDSSAALADETREITGDLRRSLGLSRDAAVMLKTLSSLSEDLGEAACRIEPVLSSHHRVVCATLDRSSRRSDRDRIVRLGAIWRGRPVRGDLADLRRQTVRTYRRARRRATELARGQEAALHPLRKVAVDHQNHLAFFAADAKGKIAKRHATVKRLRDRLGLCHDLEVLRDFVRTRADISAGDLIKLEEVLGKRHRRLLDKAVKIAETLFGDRPRDFERWFRDEIGRVRQDEEPKVPAQAQRNLANLQDP
ncbi:MAG: CHAD domain-containing protein [Hyphomicrobiales bacterium]